MHPEYFSTKFAKSYVQDNDLPLVQVQHHHAHIASVMAEHDLKGDVIGVSLDGQVLVMMVIFGAENFL